MNLLSLIALILVYKACVHATNLTSIENQWKDFKISFNKSYETPDEEEKRFKIFKENSEKFSEHNKLFEAREVTFKMGVHRDADLTFDEIDEREKMVPESHFESLRRLLIFKEVSPQYIRINESIIPPESLDWRDRGAVTAVKDQGVKCGACWAFATLASVESHHFIRTGESFDLSEQQLVDCSIENGGCEGGNSMRAFSYLSQNEISSEESYPYEEKKSECRADGAAKTSVKVYGHAEMEGDENVLKAAVNEFGPIIVFINASPKTFHFYSEGVYNDPECSNSVNHALLVVGYGYDENLEIDYWIVKNSWSEKWGEGGFIRMARNKDGLCGITYKYTFPLLEDNGQNKEIYVMFITIAVLILIALVLCCICFGCVCIFKRCRRQSSGFNLY